MGVSRRIGHHRAAVRPNQVGETSPLLARQADQKEIAALSIQPIEEAGEVPRRAGLHFCRDKWSTCVGGNMNNALMMRMVGTMVDIIVKIVDEKMIVNMPRYFFFLSKTRKQNETSFRLQSHRQV